MYVKTIKEKLSNYYAAWLPNEKLKLGDVGPLNSAFFYRTTSLGDLGINFNEVPDDSSTPFSMLSGKEAEIDMKLKGETNEEILPVAKAGVKLNFKKMGGFIFEAAETYEPTIGNIEKLKNDILNAYKSKKWNKDWAVIAKIMRAPCATCIISNSSNSEIVFETNVNISDPTELGKVGVDLSWKKQTGDLIKIVGAQNVTPFFQLLKLHCRPFRKPQVRMETKGLDTLPTDMNAMKIITPERLVENPEIEDYISLKLVE